jgi:pilus assembly protein CpaB
MEPKNKSILLGLFMGVIAGFTVGVLVSGFIGYAVVKKKEQDVRRGWNLVPVVVAAQDIPEGTKVTYDMLRVRNVPEQFVTSSVVKQDSAAYIIDQRINVPMQQGDLLLWSQVEARKVAEPSAP